MYCINCKSVFPMESLRCCIECSRILCMSCKNKHDLYFKKRHQVHQEVDISELKRYFEIEASFDQSACGKKHDENSDYFCQKCQQFTCSACLSLHHQHEKNKKVKQYVPQIQSVLIACESMLEAKENELQTGIEKLRRRELDLREKKRTADKLILQKTKQIWFRIAMALRRREKEIRTRVMLSFDRDANDARHRAENLGRLLEILQEAKGIVEKLNHSSSIPLQKEIFSNLSILNRINSASFVETEKSENNFPQFVSPSDKDIDQACHTMLQLLDASPPRQTELFLKAKDGPKHSEEKNQNDTDLFSFGETDEDFGEYFVVSAPQRNGRSMTTQQVVKGPIKPPRAVYDPIDKFKPTVENKIVSNSKNRDDLHVTFDTPRTISHARDRDTMIKSSSQSDFHHQESRKSNKNKTSQDLKSRSTGNLFHAKEQTRSHDTYFPMKDTHCFEQLPKHSTKQTKSAEMNETSNRQHKLSEKYVREYFSHQAVQNYEERVWKNYSESNNFHQAKKHRRKTKVYHDFIETDQALNQISGKKFGPPLQTAQRQILLTSHLKSTAL